MKFKDYYDTECASLLADKISAVTKKFPKAKFIDYIDKKIADKEFLERQDIFVDALEQFLTGDYEQHIATFLEILGPELETTTGMFTHGWWLWPIGRYIERHGTKNSSLSLQFIYELTKRFTGEFAIRPIIFQEARATLKVLLKWSKDSNVHVRRLASEAMRVRLPWAKKSLAVLNEFELYKKVLSNLKSNKEKFVQKSVGNNLNDLMKENPVLANKIIAEWKKDSPSKETLWIIKHGMRNLKK